MKSSFPSRSDYESAFLHESVNEYPPIDALELRLGYVLDRARLEHAAKTLACPVKRNRPNWQHGRVIYAVLRKYLETQSGFVSIFDCGTAKGFSALCMAFALADSKTTGVISSVDVIDPQSTEPRNSILDLEGPKDVLDFVSPWSEAQFIKFHKSTGVEWLKSDPGRIHFAFIDGKHQYTAVKEEIRLLAARQMQGDIAIFDDLQIQGVEQAVTQSRGYSREIIEAKPGRRYAVAVRQ
jgi:predicted O-methyltransferase YrrM